MRSHHTQERDVARFGRTMRMRADVCWPARAVLGLGCGLAAAGRCVAALPRCRAATTAATLLASRCNAAALPVSCCGVAATSTARLAAHVALSLLSWSFLAIYGTTAAHVVPGCGHVHVPSGRDGL